jgi:HEPN domain-containing protein
VSLSERDPKAEAVILARKAGDDAAAMRELAGNPEISDEIVGFHAQQAVEKWLKAVLGSMGTEFEYTHDLRRLIAEVVASVGEFPFDIAEVVGLTEHAVPLRYDEILDTEPLDRDATLALVDQVGRWAETRLSEAAEGGGSAEGGEEAPSSPASP